MFPERRRRRGGRGLSDPTACGSATSEQQIHTRPDDRATYTASSSAGPKATSSTVLFFLFTAGWSQTSCAHLESCTLLGGPRQEGGYEFSAGLGYKMSSKSAWVSMRTVSKFQPKLFWSFCIVLICFPLCVRLRGFICGGHKGSIKQAVFTAHSLNRDGRGGAAREGVVSSTVSQAPGGPPGGKPATEWAWGPAPPSP